MKYSSGLKDFAFIAASRSDPAGGDDPTAYLADTQAPDDVLHCYIRTTLAGLEVDGIERVRGAACTLSLRFDDSGHAARRIESGQSAAVSCLPVDQIRIGSVIGLAI